VVLCLGSQGDPRGVGVFLRARYPCIAGGGEATSGKPPLVSSEKKSRSFELLFFLEAHLTWSFSLKVAARNQRGCVLLRKEINILRVVALRKTCKSVANINFL